LLIQHSFFQGYVIPGVPYTAMDLPLSLTLYHFGIGDFMESVQPVSEDDANGLFLFFKNHRFFNWGQSHNFCEARAEAISLFLTAADISHAKAWVFGAAFLKKGYVGGLKHNWNYHVAIAIPVKLGDGYLWMVIDPALHEDTIILDAWASGITAYPHSYHCIKFPDYYVFPDRDIGHGKWHKRAQDNFRWTMQGLLGIHALDMTGKAKLAFQKKRIKNFTGYFKEALRTAGKSGLF
jgi:hypothetical protein